MRGLSAALGAGGGAEGRATRNERVGVSADGDCPGEIVDSASSRLIVRREVPGEGRGTRDVGMVLTSLAVKKVTEGRGARVGGTGWPIRDD